MSLVSRMKKQDTQKQDNPGQGHYHQSPDYHASGFKCGIEIHQQLDTGKLFCNCPCDILKGTPDNETLRRLRASAGETGRIDKAAAFEQSKNKSFIYDSFRHSTCLVELDEEPPHDLNHAALKACLQVCRLLNMRISDYVQFMRKVVVDGSNVTGFQRTALVGRDGYISLDDGTRVRVETVCLEEEASQVLKRDKDQDTYNISRQGIPLIEIATAPDIRTAVQAREAAGKLGMILRSVDGMKRGIGSIRQDVNVSVKGGARVEIKGFQEIKSMPKVIDFEIGRHLTLIRDGKNVEKEVRRATADFRTEYMRPMPGASRMYPETDVPIVRVDLSDVKAGKTLEQRSDDLAKKYSLRQDSADQLVKSGIQFTKITQTYKGIDAQILADIILNVPKEIRKRYRKDISVLDNPEVLLKLDKGEITREAVLEILVDLAHGKRPDYGKYRPVDDSELEGFVKTALKKNPGAPLGALMGIVMKEYRGKVDGKKVMQIIKQHLK